VEEEEEGRGHQAGARGEKLKGALLVCILCLAASIACPAFQPAAAEEPAGLPDLQVEGIIFTVGGVQTRGAPVGTERVGISVHVNDKGRDNLTSVNITVTVNGTVLGVKPPDIAWGDRLKNMVAFIEWPIGALPVGLYEIGALVNDSAGDLDPADNAASANFTIAPRPPSLGIRLDQTTVEANVSGISSGSVILTGNLTATDLFGQTLDVKVRAEDTGWITAASPSDIRFVQDSTVRFSMSVIIPAGALAFSEPVTVKAATRSLGRDLNASASVTVAVRPFYSFELTTRQPIIELETGGACTFTFLLRNDGNTNDSFTLEIANSGDLESKDAFVTLSCQTLGNVGPGETRNFKVTFRGPQDWTIWKADSSLVLVKASSVGARSEYLIVARSCPVYAKETGMFPPWLFTLTVIAIAFSVGSFIFMGVVALLVAWRKTGGPRDEGQAGGLAGREPKPPDI
jgi:hypothetical protein